MLILALRRLVLPNAKENLRAGDQSGSGGIPQPNALQQVRAGSFGTKRASGPGRGQAGPERHGRD